ncbi:hypothetical protein EV672_102271 [Aquabacterium commune]|uniref:Uncharacterized protein n=1 Tax=Aquabacterium commune TaxID=70586 RepID=A0A4R6RHG8_9BURK|nr:hypothetical protein EV672_102271 [Aquabacterium commune]
MLIHTGWQCLIRNYAAPSDRCARDVQQNIAAFNRHVVQPICLALIEKCEVAPPELTVMDIQTSDQRNALILVSLLSTKRSGTTSNL